jgi:itaconate CoA-transferase
MYHEEYRNKLTTPEEAVAHVRENGLLCYSMAQAEPPALLAATAARLRSGDLKRLRVFHMLPLQHACQTILALDLADCVEVFSGFVSAGERGTVAVGLNQFIPNHFHQVPRLLSEYLEVDTVLATVSPMDDTGYFSFGLANTYVTTAARCARLLIVEVNEHMPRVFGDALIHVSEVGMVVENHVPLPELPEAEPSPEDRIIGKTIAGMVPDGATLQVGWGSLPSVVAQFLEGHKDLGIHTEVLGSSMVPLMKKGVVNGRRKTLHPRKHVFTAAVGGRELIDFVNNNPAMESYPVSYTNHPSVIAKNDNMISINSILEVDLTGQCNAEFLRGQQFSGTGGQLDFVRGAFDSRGGKSILAFASTAQNGTVSRVVPRLSEGTVVTTPRMDVHYLVTEHGVTNLKGKSTGQRALAIIELANPRFRDGLLRAAEDMRLL